MSRKILGYLIGILIILSIFFLSFKETKITKAKECRAIADIMFAIDSTGSMGGVISTAQTQAKDIMNGIEETLGKYNPDIRYGVVDFRDYADGAPWPYIKRQALTYDKNAIENAINQISAGGGGDFPEAYARVMYESYHSTNYRNQAVKLLIMMGDDRPHDKATSSSTDPAYSPPNYYDPVANISTNDIAQNMKSNGIILINLHSGSYNNMWQEIAQITGGDNYSINSNPGDLVGVIKNAVVKAIFDADDDGYLNLNCPCDPEVISDFGLDGCYDCDDTDSGIIHECFYGGLVPCGRLVDNPDTDINETDPCTLCHLFVLGKKVVDYAVVNILVPLAILMITIGGVMLLTAGGDPGRVSKGKSILKATLIAVAIVLAGWLIVDTIITFLTPAGSPFQNWSTISC